MRNYIILAVVATLTMGIKDAVGEVTFDAADGTRRFTCAPKRLSNPTVRIRNLPKGVYNLYLGGKINTAYSADELAAGINVTHPLESAYEVRVEVVEPPKDLPDLTTKDRAELKALFEANVFGKRTVERPPVQRFEQVSPDETIYGGLGVKRRMKAVFGNGKGDEMEMPFVAYVPTKPGKHPAFVMVAPNPDTIAEPVGNGRPPRMPVKELLERGYAGIPYYNHACALDLKPGFPMTNGVWRVFGPIGANRTADSWGAISAWAWGASRVMDWVETRPEFDVKRIAVVGLSRNGKTALWAGATDVRFALTISCCSGCGGAKLNRVDLPASEHVKDLQRNFPHWFANNFYSWAGREETAPFDMHGIVAMCAPRRVIITSATEDAWAGPYGEYLSGKLASPAWERVGLKGLVGDYPMPAEPLQEGSVAYHRRIGPHGQTSYDWQRYMDFFDK